MSDITSNRTRPRCVFGAVLICLLIAFCFAPSAKADAMYAYTGQPFTSGGGVELPDNVPWSCLNSICNVYGSITLASPIPPNSTFSISIDKTQLSLLPPDLISFSLFAGNFGFSNTGGGLCNFSGTFINLVTGSNGEIVAWDFDLGCGNRSVDTSWLDGSGDDFIYGMHQGYASNLDTPGTWTLSAVPEPSSLMLLGIGLIAMLGLATRKLESTTGVRSGH